MALLFGVHENTDPAATVKRVGGNATRLFTPGVIGPRDLVKAATAVCAPTWAAGLTAVWSFKPNPADVASGAFKPYVQALGEFLRANPGKPTVVVIWHEPENDIPKAFADAAAFVRLFDTVAGWLRDKHPGVVTAHAALAYRYGDGVDITDAVAAKWRTSADIHCADVYSGRTNPLNTILPELSSYRRWRKFVARDSRWGITERGWTTTKSGDVALRVAAMSREAQWLAGLGDQAPEVYLQWNTGGTESDAGLIYDAGAEQIAKTINGQYAATALARAATAPAPPAAPPPAAPAAPASAPTPAGSAAPPAAPAAPGAQSRTMTCPLCAGSGHYTFTV